MYLMTFWDRLLVCGNDPKFYSGNPEMWKVFHLLRARAGRKGREYIFYLLFGGSSDD